MEPSTPQITRAIASGDTEAFARFYEKWFDRMYAEAFRLTRRDESFCLDVVQDAMMKVIHCMKPLETDAALTVWMKRVIHSCALDALRRETRRAKRELVRSRADLHPPEQTTREQIQWLRSEIDRLDADAAELLNLRIAHGWTLRRIADLLKLTPGAVDGRITRILSSLRARAGGSS